MSTARHTDTPKAPDWGVNYGITELWSEVMPGLWMGGTADEDMVSYERVWQRAPGHGFDRMPVDTDVAITAHRFEAVVTLFDWARPVGEYVEELRFGIMDSTRGAEGQLKRLRRTVVWAHERWRDEDRVLVRCQAGLNRSGLVTALVLVRDGMEPEQAITAVRLGRSEKALFNKAFVKLIMETPAEFWRD